jgi:hypothetical protein
MSKLIISGGTLITANSKLLGIRSYLSEELQVDQIPQAGFSLRRINKAYTGPIIEVTDGSSHTDIYTNKETISKEYLLSLVDSSGDLYVTKWYDQFNAGYRMGFEHVDYTDLPRLINGNNFYHTNSNPRSFGLNFNRFISNKAKYELPTSLSGSNRYKIYVVISNWTGETGLLQLGDLPYDPSYILATEGRIKFMEDGDIGNFSPVNNHAIFNLGMGKGAIEQFDVYQDGIHSLIRIEFNEIFSFTVSPFISEIPFSGCIQELIINREDTIVAGSSNNVFKNQDNYFFKE